MNLNLTLLGQSFAFLLFVLFCMRYVWPPVMRALEERRNKIADGLKAAEQSQQQLREAGEQAHSEREQARQEASAIIAQARDREGQILENARQQAKEEGERILAAARVQLDQETNRAREGLRSQLSQLIFLGVEKVLGRTVDAGAHEDLVRELQKQL